jgi:two-component system, response regulator / RNA-binding antiterminator
MKVLIVDESAERAPLLRDGLERAGYEVTQSLSSADIMVIHTESPSRDVLEHLVTLSQHTPRPVVMFATDGAPETIRRAVRAGVSAYIVDGLDPARVKSIVAAAIATFEEFQRLRLQLAERKSVERAKAILMKKHRLDEEAAYSMLRRIAMDRNLRIGEVAQRVIDGA